MKRTTSPRLKLNRTTVRTLQNTELVAVGGGLLTNKNTQECSYSCSCDTWYDYTCSPTQTGNSNCACR